MTEARLDDRDDEGHLSEARPAQRLAFEELVAETAYRPETPEAVLSQLEGQLLYLPEPRRDALEELADALALALSDGAKQALPSLSHLSGEAPEQPLCHYYLLAARLEVGDTAGAREALARLARVDPEDPMVELHGLSLDGKPVPDITEEARLVNIAKFANTPLLKNPYQLAVGAVFEAIRDREDVRVLDVGVGSGAQMSELLGLLGREEHRVRRLEVVGLDFVQEFLDTAGENLQARAGELAGRVEFAYVPVVGHVEEIDDATADRITEGGPLDAANASIALHEVPGEAKLDALRNLRRLAPRCFVLAEWNYCLENVLPETSVEFLFNIRRASAAMAAAVREQYPLSEARAAVRTWLSVAGGQLTCAASDRQECFLDIATWTALLEQSGFVVSAPVATSRFANGTPIALVTCTLDQEP